MFRKHEYESFVAMLTRTGVVFTARANSDGGHDVLVRACAGAHNTGEGGLYTVFVFTAKGRLDCIGTWQDLACGPTEQVA